MKNHDVFWFTDKDEIAPNDEKITEATKIIAHYFNHYLKHDLRHIRFGTTKCDDGTMEIEDMAAIPDLAAGVVLESIETKQRYLGQNIGRILVDLQSKVSRKTQFINSWLSESWHPLKKIVVCIDQEGDGYNTKFVKYYADSPSYIKE